MISFKLLDAGVEVTIKQTTILLDSEECRTMAYSHTPEKLEIVLEKHCLELSESQDRKLSNLCLKAYQENREITVKEKGGNICIWWGLEKEWLAFSDYEKAGFFIESYPDTALDDEIVSRLVYTYTN